MKEKGIFLYYKVQEDFFCVLGVIMKKILVTYVLFSVCVLSAHSWTFLREAENRDTRLMLPKIIDKQGQVQACIQDESKKYTQQSRNASVTHYRDQLMKHAQNADAHMSRDEFKSKMIVFENKYQDKFDTFKMMYYWTETALQKIYNEWFDSVRSYINSAGRAEEFSDILNLLPQQVKFTFFNEPTKDAKFLVSCDRNSSNTDIDLFVELRETDYNDRYGGSRENLGTCDTQTRRNVISFEPSDKFSGPAQDTLLHEVGHSLGLSEMYIDGNCYDSSIFTMDTFQKRDGQKVHSAMNDGYRVLSQEGQSKRERKVECDDVDGIINIMDHYYGDKMSNRRTKGWMSLCKNRKIAYAYALPFSVTEDEIIAHKQFVSNGYKGSNPFASKIKYVAQKAANVDEQLADKLAREEAKRREDEAARLAAAARDSINTQNINRQVEQKIKKDEDDLHKKEADRAAGKPGSFFEYECPVCHQSFKSDDMLKARITTKTDPKTGKKKVVSKTIIHEHCNASWPGMKSIEEKYIKRYK